MNINIGEKYWIRINRSILALCTYIGVEGDKFWFKNEDGISKSIKDLADIYDRNAIKSNSIYAYDYELIKNKQS